METNPQIELAFNFLEYTGTNIFLTGKAGTGKTTFLRKLKEISPKRMIVVAPTGVAAINAGGVTMHSFFQLAFGPYISGDATQSNQQKSQFNRFSKEKINIIRSLDLLVIDEISMVRADLLDAVSDVLRRYRDRNKPFGGVQLLLIGDLQQLAPVVKDEEWELLQDHYATAFFFDSKALRESHYLSIELNKVYRQSDSTFLDILNRIRDNNMDEATLNRLNQRYIPQFEPNDSEGYITLTTHNYLAHQINERKLKKLQTHPYTFKAAINGDFPIYSYPTDEQLTLKEGAQVMFVKNDSSVHKRYYNGKIGVVVDVNARNISVQCKGDARPITVETEEWSNVKYTINEATKEITESIEGTYTQYPLKTAWAITIHKSQGLTFERSIVDASAAFSHGQVYVALSRCKTLEGLVLSSPISSQSVIKDDMVQRFSQYVEENQPSSSQLEQERKHYYIQQLCELFDFSPLYYRLSYVSRLFTEGLHKLYPERSGQYNTAMQLVKQELQVVGERFQMQLTQMAQNASNCEQDSYMNERINKGVAYFSEKMEAHIIPLVKLILPEIDNKEVRKGLEKAMDLFVQQVLIKTLTLKASKESFTVKQYLIGKAQAVLQPVKVKAEKSKSERVEKVAISEDIAHPILYETLKSWRKERAEVMGIPVYTILQQKALIGISNTLPTGSKELLAIPGIGKVIIEKYGVILLDMVDAYRHG